MDFNTPISVSDVIQEVSNQVGCHDITGGSGKGWSYYSSFMACPQQFYLKYRSTPENFERGFSQSLEIGSAFHALHFFWRFDWGITPEELVQAFYDGGCDERCVTEAQRIFQAYQDYYVEDYITPIAGEVYAECDGRTCRYDLIGEIPKGKGFAPGIWAIDLKSAGRFDDKLLDGWDMHGEITGQAYLWEASGMHKRFGPLAGVMVDITGKQKIPQFARIPFFLSGEKLNDHWRSLQHVDAQIQLCEASDYWPRYRQGCIGQYGKCRFYDYCRHNAGREEW